MDLQWYVKHWTELDTGLLYQILSLRAEVFVVEQNCPYQDLDGRDQTAYHIFALHIHKVIATARILPPYNGHCHIGRVCTALSFRGSGTGRSLMQRSVEAAEELFPDFPIEIAAQYYLVDFYRSFGFQPLGQVYLLDGIDHINMLRMKQRDNLA